MWKQGKEKNGENTKYRIDKAQILITDKYISNIFL